MTKEQAHWFQLGFQSARKRMAKELRELAANFDSEAADLRHEIAEARAVLQCLAGEPLPERVLH